MLPHDKALALSALETEQLRDLRSRLNRAAGGKASAPLMVGFFKVAQGVGLAPAIADENALAVMRTAVGAGPDWTGRAADGADLRGLKQLLVLLHRWKQANAPEYAAAVTTGGPQAIISRRLALAGREPAKEINLS